MNANQPLIIPRAEHPISRKMLSPNALRALYRLRDNGFTAYLVGGCVRDLLLGREPKDFDLVTDATPGQIKRLFRNCRLVGRRFRLAHLHFADEILEVATFRSAVPDEADEAEAEAVSPAAEGNAAKEERRSPRHLKSEEGMLLRDNVFGTPQQDALRRDFTVNALFYNIADFSIIDYTGGMADLESGVIRTIGEPAIRFTEDPVRMLRAVRFAAMLGFSVEAATWDAILGQSGAIAMASAPRLYEEILKLFLLGEGEKSYQLLRQTGLFAALFPGFSDWLERETDNFPHTRVGQALDRIDSRVQGGEKVEPQLLLALMFGQYLEEKGEGFRARGANLQQAVDLAIAELLEELSATVQVPGRVVGLVRHIIGYQHRFRKTPGRHPQSFLKRPGFAAALDYLCIIGEITGRERELGGWWHKYLGENPIAPAGQPAGEESAPPPAAGKRRRRRRKRPRGGGA
ncbi:MAG: polynucleotide adenylyltransferase PcnB [Geobacteraceae bacterium]|nr:polynucleotide adenylyltransferase PcnB [Geobacteraceae bacterium]